MTATKRCTKCGKVKPLSEYYPKPRKPGTYRTICKACMTSSAVQHQRELRAARAHVAALNNARLIRLHACPDDPIVGIPLYRPGLAMFHRGEFLELLEDGALPDGSQWHYRSPSDSTAALWEVRRGALCECGGMRVIRPSAAQAADD